MIVKTITLHFANGDEITIPFDDIESCRMHDIQDGVRVAEDGQLIKEKVMYGLDLVLNDSANQLEWDGERKPFERILRIADLQHLAFEFEGMRGKSYRVAWHDMEAVQNAYQTTTEDNGNLHVYVRVT
ncbi:hypothetical protein PJK55_13465 [Exiguobacterium sp. MMG028]|uniref:hypothetical protein n=1 Tax=Exiguobacterium sp. MMG028 TaxID=3021979 RepID=UPI0022FE12BE|nr:hypothetical protein [Exiguobacterium sp. MMG028]MDA5561743.1 hypothetical protein [Exiguobacterium sp. MMG028]